MGILPWDTEPFVNDLLPGRRELSGHRDRSHVANGDVGINDDREAGLTSSVTEIDIGAGRQAGMRLEVGSRGKRLEHLPADQ